MSQQFNYGVTYPYTPQDEQTLQRFAATAPVSKPGYITDFLGVKTNVGFFPGAEHRGGAVVSAIAIPDDTLHAEGYEYLAIAEALSASRSAELCVVEIGAGWGPWICAGAVISRQLGKRSHLLATEMLPDKIYHLFHHLRENDIYTQVDQSLQVWHEGNGCRLKVVCAAAAATDGSVFVPVVDGALDHGARPSATVAPVDYRGKPMEYVPLQALSLQTLLADLRVVDFLHVDIQGFEREVIPPALPVLKQKVATLFVGTHSRSIEGELFERMYSEGWQLLRERPCSFQFEKALDVPLEAATQMDGGQVWRNPWLA